MKRISLLFLLAFIAGLMHAQSKNALLLIDDEEVSVEEFKRVYEKNNPNALYNDSAISEYLDLYINFKLKVAEAKALGYDTMEVFVNELKGYRDQLAKPYFKNEEVEEQIVQEAYNRLSEEVEVSHLLIKFPKNPSPEDTAKAYSKAYEAYNAIKNNEISFEEAVVQYSDDYDGGDNPGLLGFIRAFVTVYEFEDAAYNSPLGEITKPVRTQFGYHIILPTNKRPSRGELQVAHIFVKADPKSEGSIQEAKAKINQYYTYLQEGQEFGDVAKNYSEDKYTAEREGLIGWYSAGRMVPALANAAYELQVDEYSEPFQSPFGFHVLKVIGEKPVRSFEEMKSELESKVRRGTRNNKPEQIVINQLKKENNFTENKEAVNKLIEMLAPAAESNNYDSVLALLTEDAIFTIAGNSYTDYNFVQYLREQGKLPKGKDATMHVAEKYKKYVSFSLKDFEDKNLEEKYPEFKHLVKEYHDGILLFNIMEDKVWNYASEDSVGLEAFFEENRDKYLWDTRADLIIIEYTDSTLTKSIEAYLNSNSSGFNQENINMSVCGKSETDCIELKYRKVEKGQINSVDDLEWYPSEYTSAVKIGEKWTIYRISEVLDPVHRELNESRGLVIADYQNYLEDKWVEELADKHNVRINAKLLKKLKQGKL
jgi:peptidyl-prolyl cis-trans isomerase SurA